MLKIGILGGAFDPIHEGHIEVAQRVLNKGLVDEVWFMPCFASMFGKKMTPALHRLKMVELAVETHPHMKAYDFEIRTKAENDTYTIMQQIKEELKDNDLYFIIGQDNANKIEFWGHSEQIMKEEKFIVIPRRGYPLIDNAWFYKPPHLFLKGIELRKPISSTLVRNTLLRGVKPIDLNTQVYEYILGFELYKRPYRKMRRR